MHDDEIDAGTAKAARIRPSDSFPREPLPPASSDAVDRSSRDSFPASDPPSWTPVNGSGCTARQR